LLPGRKVSIAGILLVLAAAGAALLIASLTGGDDKRKPAGPGEAPTGASVELVSAEDFDPDGDQEEHASEVGQAIDGNPDTPWSTETYSASANVEEAAAKPGVGLIVEAAEPVAARTIEISSTTGGWSGEVYGAASGPPTQLSGWGGPLGTISAADTDQSVQLDAAAENQFFLIWITDLADAEGGFNVEIGEVELTA
jgi:serine/threonine-protein kinase